MTRKDRVSTSLVVTTILIASVVVGGILFFEGSFSFKEATLLTAANCILLFLLWRLVSYSIFR